MDTNADKDLLGAGSDIDRGSKGGFGLLWGALGVIIILLGTVLLFVLKGRQPVYLKPKTKKPLADNEGSQGVPSDDPVVTKNEMSNVAEAVEFDKTHANENSDVVRSELKSLRQSAVAMSVSQKDGANQIVQDWLETEGEDAADDSVDDIEQTK